MYNNASDRSNGVKKKEVIIEEISLNLGFDGVIYADVKDWESNENEWVRNSDQVIDKWQ